MKKKNKHILVSLEGKVRGSSESLGREICANQSCRRWDIWIYKVDADLLEGRVWGSAVQLGFSFGPLISLPNFMAIQLIVIKVSTSWKHEKKSQGMIKVSVIDLLEDMNVWNPSSSCRKFSVQIKSQSGGPSARSALPSVEPRSWYVEGSQNYHDLDDWAQYRRQHDVFQCHLHEAEERWNVAKKLKLVQLPTIQPLEKCHHPA